MSRKQRRAASRAKRPSKHPPAEALTSTGPGGVADLLTAGWKLHQAGRLAEAEIWYRRVLAARPDHANALNLLGIVASQTGRHELAVELIRQAVQKNGQDASYFSNLGTAFFDHGKLDEAVGAYRQAIRVKPDYAEAYCNLGSALEQQGKFDEAIAAYRQAISIKPDYADAYSNLGVALEEQGKFNEARNALERAIELAPSRTVTYRLLGDVKRFAATDPHLAAMQKLARDMASLSAENQIDLHFALAKAYGDIGDHARSFRNLLQGNALKRQRVNYNEADTRDLFSRIQDVFTLARMRGKRGFGDPSSKPVFIIGMPRSGTTLVEQILASHPRVYGAGELDYMANAVAKLSGRDAASMRLPELVSSMTDEQLRQLGASYVSSISTIAPNAERIVDKLPINFLFAGLIHLALPNARIIHTRRDPIDTCVSCFGKLFSKGHAYSYDLAELGGYYRAYEALMEHWRKVLPPGVMLEVQYEDVTADLEAAARRIVAHCGLEWDDACLSFHETERAVRTTIQVRQPIYRNSIGRWRLYERHLGPLIGALGLHFGRGSESEPSALVQSGVAASGGAFALSFSDVTSTSQIPIDAINTVAIHNGLLRIGCVAAGPNNEARSSGILLISCSQVGQILGSLRRAVEQLDEKVRDQTNPGPEERTAN
jgi:tetratricopeptide (TPR) repeat protein